MKNKGLIALVMAFMIILSACTGERSLEEGKREEQSFKESQVEEKAESSQSEQASKEEINEEQEEQEENKDPSCKEAEDAFLKFLKGEEKASYTLLEPEMLDLKDFLYDDGPVKYALFDIDGNGVPELITYNSGYRIFFYEEGGIYCPPLDFYYDNPGQDLLFFEGAVCYENPANDIRTDTIIYYVTFEGTEFFETKFFFPHSEGGDFVKLVRAPGMSKTFPMSQEDLTSELESFQKEYCKVVNLQWKNI